MKKAISILSIISVVLAVSSLLLAIGFLSVFWEPMCLRFSPSREMVEAGPIIPIGDMVYLVGCLVVAVIICVCTKSNKNIVIEIISIVLLGVVLPLLAWHISKEQTAEIAQNIEVYKLAALTAAKSMSNSARGLMNVSATLCLVVCGMGISEKVILKKDQPNTNQTVG